MKKLILLISLFFSIGTIQAVTLNINQTAYNNCIQQSNKLNDPYSRDRQKVFCFQKYKSQATVDTCLKLASILEYTSIADEFLSSCIDIFGKDPNKCLRIAGQMVYGENADQALWSCIQLQPEESKKNKEVCQKFAKNMTLPHNKNRAKELCLYQSEK